MKTLTTFALLASAPLAAAHYPFPNFVGEAPWTSFRKITHWSADFPSPLWDLQSPALMCNQRNGSIPAPSTRPVEAGETVYIAVGGRAEEIYHPGPVQAYMAKAPGRVVDFDGTGAVWFKIYEDEVTQDPGDGYYVYDFPHYQKSEVSFIIPPCLADGEYLLRVQQIGLHGANQEGQAEFFLSCAQVSVTGGTGTASQSDLVSFPDGSFQPTDPGLLIQINKASLEDDWEYTPYQHPGPALITC